MAIRPEQAIGNHFSEVEKIEREIDSILKDFPLGHTWMIPKDTSSLVVDKVLELYTQAGWVVEMKTYPPFDHTGIGMSITAPPKQSSESTDYPGCLAERVSSRSIPVTLCR